jgi:tRNA1(Val) A37 N6-methylase TrmN6
MTDDAFFRGWAKPGPRVPGGVAPAEGETLDAISGHFRLFQYRDGHRFSTDDVLTAWYGTACAGAAARVLDLGSGIGSVGMIAAWRLPGARFVTVEAQAISVKLARKSKRYNGLDERYEIREGDFRDESLFGAEEKFDLVLGSPPYFPLGTGVLGDHEQKIACRFEVRGDVRDYCATAARRLAPGGWFACVFPTAQSERVFEGARDAELTVVRSREAVLKEGEAPLLTLFAMQRAGDLPEALRSPDAALWRDPPLVIRQRDGKVHPEYRAIKLSVGFPP